MTPATILLRQVHPNFLPEGELSSQAFVPFPKDHGGLSVYDGDQVSAAVAWQHYTGQQGLASAGVWGVSCAEVSGIGLDSRPDPLPDSPAHALIEFGRRPDRDWRKLAKQLKQYALGRGRLHPD